MKRYVLYPLEARPDEKAERDAFYRECREWNLRILREYHLSDLHRLVGLLVMAHLNAKTGECNPSIPRLAAWLGKSVNAVRDAIEAIAALGYWSYGNSDGEKNKGGKGCSHQFTFYVTPDQAEGLLHKPTARAKNPQRRVALKPKPSMQPEGIETREIADDFPNPPNEQPIPSILGPDTLHFGVLKPAIPSGQPDRNSKTNSKLNSIEQGAFASQTTPTVSKSENLKETNGSKEARKRTSEVETVAPPLAQSEGLTRLEIKQRKLGPELSLIVRRSQIDYRERDGKLYIATSSADDAKAVTDNEQVVIDALRPDFPFACGIHAWVAA
jgi:helix-turn-helix protein